MKVSIVIPNYNTGKYLGKCLESIFSQGYNDFEVIVVDGYSNDESEKVLTRYEHKWPGKFRWVLRDRRGEVDAINYGMGLTTGDIVAFLDADDTYEKDCFKWVARTFSDFPDVSWLYSKAKIIDSNDKEARRLISRAKEVLQSRYSYNSLLCVDYIVQPTVFMRKSLWEQAVLNNPAYKYSFDYECWLRLGHAGHKPAFIDRHLANWRAHSESISVQEYKAEARQALEIARRYSKANGKGWLLPIQWLVYVCTVGLYWLMSKSVEER